MKNSNPLIEKIKKLYETAEGFKALGDFQSAALFLGKVEKLLLENSLELNDITSYSTVEDIYHSDERENGVEYYKKEFLSEGQWWEIELMNVIVKHNFCYVYWRGYNDNTLMSKADKPPFMVLVGKPSDIEICKYIFQISRDIFRKLAPKTYENQVKKIRNLFAVEATSKQGAWDVFSAIIEERVESLTWIAFAPQETVQATKKINNRIKGYDHMFGITTYDKNSFGPDDFMPESYKEADKDKKQKYYIKDLAKFNMMADRSTFIRSFLLGVSLGLDTQLAKSKREFEQEQTEDKKEQLTSLIIRKNNDLEDYKNNKLQTAKIKTVNASTAADSLGFRSGIEAGYKTHIAKGLNSDTGESIKTLN